MRTEYRAVRTEYRAVPTVFTVMSQPLKSRNMFAEHLVWEQKGPDALEGSVAIGQTNVALPAPSSKVNDQHVIVDINTVKW